MEHLTANQVALLIAAATLFGGLVGWFGKGVGFLVTRWWTRAPISYRLGGGRGGIRTHGRLSPSLVFKTSSLNHSDTLPYRLGAGAYDRLIGGSSAPRSLPPASPQPAVNMLLNTRTALGADEAPVAFKTAALNHSATRPGGGL